MNLQKEELSPASVNANLVALCDLEESNNFICLGYGNFTNYMLKC